MSRMSELSDTVTGLVVQMEQGEIDLDEAIEMLIEEYGFSVQNAEHFLTQVMEK